MMPRLGMVEKSAAALSIAAVWGNEVVRGAVMEAVMRPFNI